MTYANLRAERQDKNVCLGVVVHPRNCLHYPLAIQDRLSSIQIVEEEGDAGVDEFGWKDDGIFGVSRGVGRTIERVSVRRGESLILPKLTDDLCATPLGALYAMSVSLGQ